MYLNSFCLFRCIFQTVQTMTHNKKNCFKFKNRFFGFNNEEKHLFVKPWFFFPRPWLSGNSYHINCVMFHLLCTNHLPPWKTPQEGRLRQSIGIRYDNQNLFAMQKSLCVWERCQIRRVDLKTPYLNLSK